MSAYTEPASEFDGEITKALANKKLLKHRDSDVKCAASAASAVPIESSDMNTSRRVCRDVDTVTAAYCLARHSHTSTIRTSPPPVSHRLRLLAACCHADLLRIYAPE